MSNTQAERRSRRVTGIVYAAKLSGHRKSYLDLFASAFALEARAGALSLRRLLELAGVKRLLFATLDDHIPLFLLVAICRSAVGRPTVALFLRPHTCFMSGRWYYRPKRLLFAALKYLPGLTVATIVPFRLDPHLAGVAHVDVVDPQYWDFFDGTALRSPQPTSLSKDVQRLAGDRRIVSVIGTLDLRKGLKFLADTLTKHPGLIERWMVVAAGSVPREAEATVEQLKSAGVYVVARQISDDELESLYPQSDLIWACYSPGYDQASGVFGRAVQVGVLPIVRRGSAIERFADYCHVPYESADYGEDGELAQLLTALPLTPHSLGYSPSALDAIKSWRERFLTVIDVALDTYRI